MKFTTLATVLSTILAVYCTIPYTIAIIKGKTKPHQLSWLVFVIMNGIVFFSQYLAGGRESVVISLIFFVGSAVEFVLSLKWGVRNTSRWDRALFAFALTTIVIWFFTRSNDLAIWLTLLIDLAATTMLILKIKAEPHSEAPGPWLFAVAAYVFTCLTLVGKPVGILYVRPLYGLIGDAALVAFIYYWRAKTPKQPQTSPLEF
jgi:hypothetical protein